MRSEFWKQRWLLFESNLLKYLLNFC